MKIVCSLKNLSLISFLTFTTTTAQIAKAYVQSGPPGASSEWSMVFDDEFDGNSLDTSKWITCYYWDSTGHGCTNSGNQELEWYVPHNISVSNGLLHMIAKKRKVKGSDGKIYNYTSGMVSTYNPGPGKGAKFSFQYGYAEARLKIPAGKGFWPAFWLLPVEPHWPPEIDVMEAIGQYPNKVVMTIHWADGALGNDWYQSQQGKFIGPDFSAGWHTFAVDWEPNYVIWYIDGVERYRHDGTNGIPNEPMAIILNLAVGGAMPGIYGVPDDTTPLRADYQVDYVIVWRKNSL